LSKQFERAKGWRFIYGRAITQCGVPCNGLIDGHGAADKASRRSFLTAVAAMAPNVLFILADDLGYADLSCYGRKDYTTPHLDALAKEGVRLTDGYSNSPVCSATRVSILTGEYQYRYPLGLHEPLVWGASVTSDTPLERKKRFTPLPLDVRTLPRDFKKRGYSTHLVGKWHLGTLPHNGPRSYGYDTFFGFLGGATDYFQHRMYLDKEVESDGLVVDDQFVKREGYLTHLLGDEAEKIVGEKHKDPWMLSLHFNAPHWPWEAPDDRERSKDIDNLLALEGNIRKYGEIVKAMDDEIGRLVAKLKETGEFDNTIIVFTSDNGGERFSDNWPFIGVKTELLEGGLRVPLIVSWPRGLQIDGDTNQVMTSMDIYPTLLGLVDGRDEEYPGFDGANLSSVFRGGAAIDRKLFWRYKSYDQEAVRDGRWKYLKIEDREYLFDLEFDERERTNEKNKHPQLFKKLKQEWADWNKNMLPYPVDLPSYHVKNRNDFAEKY